MPVEPIKSTPHNVTAPSINHAALLHSLNHAANAGRRQLQLPIRGVRNILKPHVLRPTAQ